MNQYDPRALKLSAKRRSKNILIFKETIKKEQAFIKQFQYIITQIDPDDPDIKKLRSTIKKKLENIKIFKQAVKDERILMRQELELSKRIA